jgi:NIMA (never in mitosis gene a)-related kinase
MDYRFKQALTEDCLAMEDSSGQIVYFDRAGFVIQLRDSLRLELQKEFKKVIKAGEAIRHENLIKYTALEKYESEIYLVREGGYSKEISQNITADLESACRVLLKILEIVRCYHEQGIPLKGLSLGQVKQDENGDFRLQDPLVMNYLSNSLEPVYRIDLPPEVIRGQNWNESSDVFSWGRLAYQLLGGEDPFRANTPEDRVEKIIKSTIMNLRDLQPKIDPRLSRSITDSLDPSPQKRPTIGSLIEQLTMMISEGSYQVSDQAVEAYNEKARNNRKKYQFIEGFRVWFKKYQVPVYISLAIVLLLTVIVCTRQKPVLTVHTLPRSVVDYYYRGIKNLDSTLVSETLYKVNKRASFDDMVINLYVSSRTRQYLSRSSQDTITVSFPEFKMVQLVQSRFSAGYRTDYILKIYSTDKINFIQRTEELTLKPIRKIWRITDIRVIREKRWTEKVEPSPLPQTQGVKVP